MAETDQVRFASAGGGSSAGAQRKRMSKETTPKPFVFVLMPFSPEFDDTYRLAIQPACERAGAFAERVDDQIFDGSILHRIYNQIAKADIVVSDLTGKNPNVFYETGYAHALGKRTLLLTRQAEDIPFDLKHFPHIIYGGKLSDLLRDLEKKVRWYVENPEKEEATAREIVVRVNNIPLIDEPCIEIIEGGGSQAFYLSIDVHNKADRELRRLECQIGVITPDEFDWSSRDVVNLIRLNEGENLHLVTDPISLLPASWATLKITLGRRNPIDWGEKFRFTVRALTESGFIDFPFSIMRTTGEAKAG